MKKIYVLDAFHPAGPQWLASRAELIPFNDPRAANWHEDADGVMVRMKPLIADDMQRAKKLRAIVKQGVGIEAIDLKAAAARGIVVANTPGINANAVCEMTMALALAVSRRLAELDRMVRAGAPIERPKFLGIALQGKTVGVIGMGNIGVRVAAAFQAALGCKILAYDPFYQPTSPARDPWASIPHERVHDLATLWPRLDMVTLHVPLTDVTRHMLGRAELAAMPPGAIVVNVARGGVIDEQALYESILSGHTFGAGIDVWEEREPPDASHPLLSLPTVVATPHAAGGTRETQEQASLQVAQELLKILEGGEPLSRVA